MDLRDDLHCMALAYGTQLTAMAGWQPGCEHLNGRNLELWLPILAMASLVEEAGVDGLVAKVERHAIKSIESVHEDAIPEVDEILLRTLKQMLDDKTWGITPAELLQTVNTDLPPLPADVAEAFKQWQYEAKPGSQDHVSATFDKANASRMLKKDLEAVEIPYKDDSGRTCDFHALRATYITHIVKGGASPKIAQHLARHGSIGLTMDVYTHIGLHDAQGALSALPHIPGIGNNGKQAEERVALRTGRDDRPIDSAYKPAYKTLTETTYSDSGRMATNGTGQAPSDGRLGWVTGTDNPLRIEHLGNDCHQSAFRGTERSGFEPEVGVYPLQRFSKPSP